MREMLSLGLERLLHRVNIASKVVIPGDRLTVRLDAKTLQEAIQLVLREGGNMESMVPIKGTLEDLFVQQVQSPEES